jgi:peroxiredoxin
LLCDTTVATERLLGDRAEDFTLKSASGENVRLREQRGKVILLVFWASHCQHCQRQLQALNALHDRYATDGFVVWAVSLDHHAEVAIEQARRWQLKHQILFDPDHAITRLYRVNDVPTALLLDRDGRVQKLFNGFHPNELPQYEASLLAILK